ncbi:DNA-methyltransferase [Aeromicrobium piscarium]|uniref:DNA-methyltransferase n=1 Tax=Aeromicrobium piscarium TaxID=2590901 RepID=UPI00163DBCBA|nr:site-specific DNA-methyltransferase [Aeromicrobium piscarium]
MKPYYEDDFVQLFHGDCLSIDEWLQADVLVTDPPYGISYNSHSRRLTVAARIRGDNDTSIRDKAMARWGEGRPAAVFGTWKRERPKGVRALLVWDTKGALGMGDTSIPWKPSHQEIYVIGKGWHGRRGTDVIRCAPVQSLGYSGRLHPHQKPVELMEHLIERAPAGTIADPFCGSGSTLVAAKAQGRRAVGIEEDERYLEVAARRLSQDVLDFGELA